MLRPAASRVLALVVATAVLLAIAVRLAWLGDDAFITLRAVENLVQGEGPRWNLADRVQTYTHPAWMLLLAAGRWLTGESFHTTIGIGLGLSTAAIVVLLRRAESAAAVGLTALLMGTARAFPEYATSGLETPLTFVLLTLFTGAVVREATPERRFSAVALLASLLAWTRLDLVLIVAPAVVASMRGAPRSAIVRRGALAAAPLLGWFAFAWFYYGSPLPVTAHAKAFGVGIPAGDLLAQGCWYLWHTTVDDPVLVVTVALGIAFGLGDRRTRWLAVGSLLQLAYVAKVGGDFMAGRFFLPPFVVALAILTPRLQALRPVTLGVGGAAAMVLMFLHGVPAWLRSPASEDRPVVTHEEARGIGDERAVYYWRLGLLAPGRQIPVFGEMQAQLGELPRERPWILLNGAVGVAGFQAGRHGHLVDPILVDPLLARLPARNPDRWRIGHVLRRIPEGSYETLATGETGLRHAGLRSYYEALRTLTQAPLASTERLATMWRMATGQFDADLRAFVAEEYYTPPRVAVPAAALATALPLGSYWFEHAAVQPIYEGGVAVSWPTVTSARTLRAQVTGLCAFRFRFVRDGVVRGEAMGQRQLPPAGVVGVRAVVGLREELVTVPAEAVDFDTVWLDFVEIPESHTATGPAAVAALVPMP